MVQGNNTFLKQFLQTKGQAKSYVFIITSSIFWVCGYIFGNQRNFSPIETNFSRSVVMVVGMYVLCRLMGLNIQFKSPKSWRVLLIRHFAFVIQGFAIAWVQFILPLGITHTLTSTGPIIVLILQAYIFKQGTVSGQKLQGCIIAFLGIILTSNGKFIYAYFNSQFQFKSDFNNYVSSSYLVMICAVLILFLTVFGWAYGVLITQQAQCHAFEIIFHFAVTNLFISSICYIFLPIKRPASQIYESFIWTGGFLILAEILFTLSLNLAVNIGHTNIACFSVVVVGYAVSIFRYGQTVDLVSLLGTFLVIAGVSFVILSKSDPSQIIQSSPDKTCIQLDQKQRI